jgi:hypothetical protein
MEIECAHSEDERRTVPTAKSIASANARERRTACIARTRAKLLNLQDVESYEEDANKALLLVFHRAYVRFLLCARIGDAQGQIHMELDKRTGLV